MDRRSKHSTCENRSKRKKKIVFLQADFCVFYVPFTYPGVGAAARDVPSLFAQSKIHIQPSMASTRWRSCCVYGNGFASSCDWEAPCYIYCIFLIWLYCRCCWYCCWWWWSHCCNAFAPLGCSDLAGNYNWSWENAMKMLNENKSNSKNTRVGV